VLGQESDAGVVSVNKIAAGEGLAGHHDFYDAQSCYTMNSKIVFHDLDGDFLMRYERTKVFRCRK